MYAGEYSLAALVYWTKPGLAQGRLRARVVSHSLNEIRYGTDDPERIDVTPQTRTASVRRSRIKSLLGRVP
jgi:hypothetical protein